MLAYNLMASSSSASTTHQLASLSSSHRNASALASETPLRQTVFFDSSISIPDLQKIGETADIEQLFSVWDYTHKKFKAWASSPLKQTPTKSAHKLTRFPFLLTPPPGFEGIKPINALSDISTESEVSPSIEQRRQCTVSLNEVRLQPPPNKNGLVKREKRGMFCEEHVDSDLECGELKFYQLKKRFGFISLDEDKSDVFLCEDDLVLSGVSIKKFKEAVFKKTELRFSFHIKNYFENGVMKRKAIDIKLITDIS
jgi:hypothetical protein